MKAVRIPASFLVLILLILYSSEIKSQVQPQPKRRAKFFETGFRYSQLDRGFFQGAFSYWQETAIGYVTFMQNEIAAGYSPWRDAFNIEATHRQVWIVLTVGGGVGYCSNLDRSTFYVKPEVGLNLSLVQIYYTYTFLNKEYNNDLYNFDSNLTIAIPIVSTWHFKAFKEGLRWRWLGVFRGIDKGEIWQY